MQGNDIEQAYKDHLSALQKEHARQMKLAEEKFSAAVEAANNQLAAVIAKQTEKVEAKTAQEEMDPPLAVWSKTPAGEDCLILNKHAAIMQMALLDQLAEVLDELSKLAPKQRKSR